MTTEKFAMPKKPVPRSKIDDANDDARFRDTIFAMEPELRQIEGVLLLVRILSEASDAVDPAALAAVAQAGRTAFDELSRHWQRALARIRKIA